MTRAITGDQIFLFAQFGVLFGFLLRDRVHCELLAFTALITAVLAGYG